MISIAWTRTGGLMGRTLEAQGEVNLLPGELEKVLSGAKPVKEGQARDTFRDTLVVAGKAYPFELGRVRGPLRKVLDQMETDLRPKPMFRKDRRK